MTDPDQYAKAAYYIFSAQSKTPPDKTKIRTMGQTWGVGWDMAKWQDLPAGAKDLWRRVSRVSQAPDALGQRLEVVSLRVGLPVRLVTVGPGKWGALVGAKEYQAGSLLGLVELLEES